jgi:hypothetical protein
MRSVSFKKFFSDKETFQDNLADMLLTWDLLRIEKEQMLLGLSFRVIIGLLSFSSMHRLLQQNEENKVQPQSWPIAQYFAIFRKENDMLVPRKSRS